MCVSFRTNQPSSGSSIIKVPREIVRYHETLNAYFRIAQPSMDGSLRASGAKNIFAPAHWIITGLKDRRRMGN